MENDNLKNDKQCAIHDVSCSFYEFAKNYIKIKDGANERCFNDEELKQVEEMQQMMDKGYELKFVHLRRGTELRWVKK